MATRITFALILVAAVVPTDAAYAQVTTTPSEILANRDQFDGQMVTIEGTMTNLRQRVTRYGDPYYKFDLSDGTQAIRVVSLGRAPCQSGAVTVEGTFVKIKRGRRSTSYNVVRASRVICHQEKSHGMSTPYSSRINGRQGYGLQLTRYDEKGWRATFYTTGMEH
jgi:DNA polymerase III alpha subunit